MKQYFTNLNCWAIWGWFLLLTMISSEGEQWGRYNLPRYMYGISPQKCMELYIHILLGGIPTPLKNHGVRHLGWWFFPRYMESHKNSWFQTTSQYIYIYGLYIMSYKPQILSGARRYRGTAPCAMDSCWWPRSRPWNSHVKLLAMALCWVWPREVSIK